MKKQAYYDMGLELGLNASQIERILMAITQFSREQLFYAKDISPKFIYQVQKAFYDVKAGVPESYIKNQENFYGREFFVSPDVLVPRDDTELLVAKSLEYFLTQAKIDQSIFVDVGTGSGCVGISLLLEILPLKFAASYLIDISSKALEIAQKNAQKFSVQTEFLESHLCQELYHKEILTGKSLHIVANLPYIPENNPQGLEKNVALYQPQSALFGGKETGFELYEMLIKQCFQLKQIHGLQNVSLHIEIGFDQRVYSQKYVEDLGLKFEYFQDSANIERVMRITGF